MFSSIEANTGKDLGSFKDTYAESTPVCTTSGMECGNHLSTNCDAA